MIHVELQRVPEGAHDYEIVARLTVADDATTTVWDPDDYLPLDIPALVLGEDGRPRRVSFSDDPATYARNLHTILRTGYVVPVVTTDTGAPA
jgi:hypothetical protein